MLTCNDCNKTAKRMKAYAIDLNKEPVFVCMKCWKELDYDKFIREPTGAHGGRYNDWKNRSFNQR